MSEDNFSKILENLTNEAILNRNNVLSLFVNKYTELYKNKCIEKSKRGETSCLAKFEIEINPLISYLKYNISRKLYTKIIRINYFY